MANRTQSRNWTAARAAITAALEAAGSKGLSTKEMIAAIGKSRALVEDVTPRLAREQLIQVVPDPGYRAVNRKRYFALGVNPVIVPEPPRVRPPKSKAPKKPRKQRAVQAKAAKPSAPVRGANMPGDAIIPKGLKIQRAETPKPRFYVESAPSIFGSLAVGSYLPSETHLSKVYGG